MGMGIFTFLWLALMIGVTLAFMGAAILLPTLLAGWFVIDLYQAITERSEKK